MSKSLNLDDVNMTNKKSEFISKCRHKNKRLLNRAKDDSNDWLCCVFVFTVCFFITYIIFMFLQLKILTEDCLASNQQFQSCCIQCPSNQVYIKLLVVEHFGHGLFTYALIQIDRQIDRYRYRCGYRNILLTLFNVEIKILAIIHLLHKCYQKHIANVPPIM